MSIHINQKYLNFLKSSQNKSINHDASLDNSIDNNISFEATRVGFGRALYDLGTENQNVVALCADLTESMQMEKFKNNFPDRFVEMGIGEQNMASVASGISAMGGIPFIGSYAMFSPGRNWEQIRTGILYNNRKAVIVGGHAGLSVGPDGGTHQAIEDIAIMRVLPNINIFSPADSLEAYYLSKLSVLINGPVYLRLAREKSPIILNYQEQSLVAKEESILQDIIELKNLHIYNSNNNLEHNISKNISIFATGPILHEVLKACRSLHNSHKDISININVYNLNILKFADTKLQNNLEHKIINILKSSNSILTVEEHQIVGGMGSMIAEISSEHCPKFIMRIGVKNRFGQSGKVAELYKEYSMDSDYIQQAILDIMHR